MANLIEYDIIRAGPDLESVREQLNRAGRHGFALQHTTVDGDGVYTFVFSKDTGRAAEVTTETSENWIDDGFVNEETSWT